MKTAKAIARSVSAGLAPVSVLTSALVTAALVSALVSTPASAKTPDNWQCFNMIGGSWAFGTAPNACTVDNMEKPAAVRTEFAPILFTDAKTNETERTRYMAEVYPVMREFAAYYIKRRNPSVTAAEVEGFQTALFTLAHQESYWTHYRDGKDGKVRSMRGDSGHGHGIMQVDDNAHFADVKAGKGTDFAENVVVGLDEFYANWVLAGKQKCVGNPTDYYTRARAAWAAYNGGPGAVCRFADPKSVWAPHDVAFKTKIDGQAWKKYVMKPDAASPIDVKCLAEGVRPCPLASTEPVPATVEGLYAASSGRFCLLKGGGLECVAAFADVACLEAREGKALPVLATLSAADEAGHSARALDRTVLCPESVVGLFSIGSDVQLKQADDFRTAANGGAVISRQPAGGVYRVLDFAVENGSSTQDRSYRVSINGTTGYLSGGDKAMTAAFFVKAPPTQPAPQVQAASLAKAGDTVVIVSANGINLRQTPGGTLLLNIQTGAHISVEAVVVQGSTSDVYYRTTWNSKTGFIYSGSLRPTDTTNNWTRPLDGLSLNGTAGREAVLASGIAYRYLRTCGDSTCAYSSAYVYGASMDPVCQNASCSAKGERLRILQEQNGWLNVQSMPRGAAGWLPRSDVNEFKP